MHGERLVASEDDSAPSLLIKVSGGGLQRVKVHDGALPFQRHAAGKHQGSVPARYQFTLPAVSVLSVQANDFGRRPALYRLFRTVSC